MIWTRAALPLSADWAGSSFGPVTLPTSGSFVTFRFSAATAAAVVAGSSEVIITFSTAGSSRPAAASWFIALPESPMPESAVPIVVVPTTPPM